MKKSILILCLMLAALPILAQQVSVDDAMASAKKFFNSAVLNGKRKVNADNRMALAYTAQADGKNHFYVFNENDADGGFIIVGADEAAQEILGYCDHGNFDYATAPDNFKWWLSQYSQQIAVGIKNGVNAREVSKRKAAANKVDVPMLIQTTWNQNYPYNSAFPYVTETTNGLDGDLRVATGCVATAMAQIMYYHKTPATNGVGSAKCSNGIGPNANTPYFFDANFGETVYDWNSMKLSYGRTVSEEAPESQAVNAVATLMKHCGVSVDTKYSTIRNGGSGASTSNVALALVNYFRYDKSILYVNRTSYGDADWEQMIYDELAAERPVLYSGTDASTNAGHAFVCDGYRNSDSKYHFNWGWGGYCDGYFAMTGSGALAPGESGIGGAGVDGAYTSNQAAVIGIKPDAGGSYVYIMEWSNPGVSNQIVTRGDVVTVNNMLLNKSLLGFGADVAVCLIDENNNEITRVLAVDFGFAVYGKGWWYPLPKMEFNTKDIQEGTYRLKLRFRVTGTNEWIDVINTGDDPVLTVTAPTGVDFIIVSGPTVKNNGYVIADQKDFSVKYVIKNYKNEPLTKTFLCYVFPLAEGGSVMSAQKEYTIPAGAEQEIELPYYWTWSGGVFTDASYSVRDYFNGMVNTVNFEVFNVVDPLRVPYSITSAGWGTLILPYEQEIPAGMSVYSCSGITDSNELVLTEVTGKMKMCTPYIVSGNPAQFNFNGPDVPNLKAVYTDGLLKGVLGDYTLQPSDYVMQKQGEKVAFFHVGNGAKNGTAAAKNRSILTLGNAEGAVGTLFFPERSDDDATKIDAAVNTLSAAEGIYTVGGQRIDKLQKGLNIVRKADGTSVKVLVK